MQPGLAQGSGCRTCRTLSHHTGQTVKVWCFKADGGLWALSRDASGANLPADLGPWTLHQEAELKGEAQDERQAIQLIEEHGFCCFRSETQA